MVRMTDFVDDNRCTTEGTLGIGERETKDMEKEGRMPRTPLERRMNCH